MTIGQLDVALRAGFVAAILLLALLLLSHRRQVGLPAALFAPLSVCFAAFVIGNTPIRALAPAGSVGAVAHALSGFAVVFLWWFCLSCFDRDFRLKGVVLGVGLVWAAIAALDRGLAGEAIAHYELSILLVPLGFLIVGHLVWRLLTERPGDLVKQRQDARVMVAVLLGGMLFIDLMADALFGFAWRPIGFAMSQNAMALGFVLWLCFRLVNVRSDVLTFGVAERSPARQTLAVPTANDRQREDLHRRLSTLMNIEKIFLDPELSFAAFVRRMGAPERTVRMLINHDLGYDHFRTFLNHHRVGEARRLLHDRGPREKLITVAMDSGFASLASFNRAFRAIEGCSPSAYRASIGEGAPDRTQLAQAGF